MTAGERREERRRRILEVYRGTGSIEATRRRLGFAVETIRRVLRGLGPSTPRVVAPRSSPLDPYRPPIRRLVLEDQPTAVLVLEEIRALGYTGGYSALKRFVRQIRPSPKVRVTTRIEHAPRDEGQVDWSPYTVRLAGVESTVHAFSLVLPFSRWMDLQFAWDEQLETLVRLHEGPSSTSMGTRPG